MLRLTLLLFSLLLALPSFSQTKERKFHFSGYVKYLQNTTFTDGLDEIITDNLLHHRLSFRYYPVKPLLFDIEVRNRMHWGELVKLTKTLGDFSDRIENNDIYAVSIVVVDKKAYGWQIMLDRAFVRYSKNKWEATLGRQRVNWGVTLAWNPNDIFNAYSLYDFDYEERPGSDAGRIVFYPSSSSS